MNVAWLRRRFVNPNGHQSSAGKSSFRRSIGGQRLFSAQTWVKGRERFLCLLLAAVMDLQALHDLHQLFTLHQK